MRDWAVRPVRGGSFSWAALSLIDSKTLYREMFRHRVCFSLARQSISPFHFRNLGKPLLAVSFQEKIPKLHVIFTSNLSLKYIHGFCICQVLFELLCLILRPMMEASDVALAAFFAVVGALTSKALLGAMAGVAAGAAYLLWKAGSWKPAEEIIQARNLIFQYLMLELSKKNRLGCICKYSDF